MQTTQKENESMQSILRKDSILGREDEIEVKNSLNIEELQIEQSNKITLIVEISNIVDKKITIYITVYGKRMLES